MKVRNAARYQARNRRLRRCIAFRAYVTLTIGPFKSGPEAGQSKRVSMLFDPNIVPAVRVLTVSDIDEVNAFFGARDAKHPDVKSFFECGDWTADAEL